MTSLRVSADGMVTPTAATPSDDSDATTVATAPLNPAAAAPADTFARVPSNELLTRLTHPEQSESLPAGLQEMLPKNWSELTPLQKHVAFFDADGSGEIGVTDTYAGLRRLGLGIAEASAFAFAINLGLGTKTSGMWSPLTVTVDNIHLGKHDSDSDIYDVDGQLDISKFKSFFATYDTNEDGYLGEAELADMFGRNRESFAGSLASKAEFGLALRLFGEDVVAEDGSTFRGLSAERVEQIYDGTMFYRIALEKAAEA